MAEGVQFASKPDFVLWPVRTGLLPVAVFLDGYKFHGDKANEDLLKRQALMRAGFVVWTLNWYDVNKVMGDKAMDVPLPLGMTSPEQHHQAIAGLAKVAGVNNTAQHLNKCTFDLLMHFLTEQDATLLRHQALFFLLQCLPARSLADPGLKTAVLESLNGLPASFTDLTPDPAALAGSVELTDDKAAAAISLSLLAGPDLLKTFDLNKALVSVSYTLKKGSEEQARYQWQRFWAAVNFLQFLPVFYAWTPDSKNSGIAAGLEWGQTQAQNDKPEKREQAPAWFENLEEELRLELDAHSANWPDEALVAEALVAGDLDEVVGEAELMFVDAKIALLLEEIEDQVAARPYLEADGWRLCASVEELVDAVNELESGA